ncbi:hypothetical protein N4P33_25405, partial [Streptomyces sp. 15-116A]|nr:hypothetical protein [Streptomyces sp. 15-116A]
ARPATTPADGPPVPPDAPRTDTNPMSDSAASVTPGADHAYPALTSRVTPSPDDPAAPSPDAPDALGHDEEDLSDTTPRSAALAARLSAELAREEAASSSAPGTTRTASTEAAPDPAPLWDDRALPLFPLQPPRTARELLADHITAMVCCAAMDTAGAAPGLDWLDGPVLLVSGERAADLSPQVLTLIESGDPTALRLWLTRQGIRPEKPVRLV